MTWPEVVSDAIKIGLPALLSGFFAYITAKHNLDRRSAEAFSSGRRKLLREAATQVSVFSRHHANYWATLYETLEKKVANEPVCDDELNALKHCEKQFRDAFQDFSNVETALLLLGEEELHDEFRHYVHAAEEFYKNAYIDNPDLTCESMGEYKRLFKDHNKSLQLKIGKAFRGNGPQTKVVSSHPALPQQDLKFALASTGFSEQRNRK